MSGVTSPANAVSNFSCAAVHGSCWTLTRMPGCARSNSGSSAATTSPSRPMAQKRSTTSEEDVRAQPPAIRSAATTPQATTLDSVGRRLLTWCGEPTTREAGLLEASSQVRVLAHDAPDERSPVVLDHGQHSPLV